MLFNLEKRITAIAVKDRKIVSSSSINTDPATLYCPVTNRYPYSAETKIIAITAMEMAITQ